MSFIYTQKKKNANKYPHLLKFKYYSKKNKHNTMAFNVIVYNFIKLIER